MKQKDVLHDAVQLIDLCMLSCWAFNYRAFVQQNLEPNFDPIPTAKKLFFYVSDKVYLVQENCRCAS